VVTCLKNSATSFGKPAYECVTIGTDNASGVGAWVDVVSGDYFTVTVFTDSACRIGADNETWFSLECQ
jgi:hypothetical protein